MTGTLAGALAARKIPTQPNRLTADAEGFIENVDGKPLITRIKVHYRVKVPNGKRDEALRGIEVHEKGCPASRSVRRGVAIGWDAVVRADGWGRHRRTSRGMLDWGVALAW